VYESEQFTIHETEQRRFIIVGHIKKLTEEDLEDMQRELKKMIGGD
jgi:hypothetical protein